MDNKKINIFLIVLCCLSLNIFAQNGNISIGPNDADASAALDVQSTTQGVLLPRMTTAQRNAIASPAEGLLVFDTDEGSFFFYQNTQWNDLSSGSGGVSNWTTSGDEIYNNNAGNVGINHTTPETALEIGVPFGSTSTTSGLQLNSSERRWRMTMGGVNSTDPVHFQLMYRNHNASTYATHFYAKHTGEIGIGTTDPTSRLHVNGDIRVSDDRNIYGLDKIVGFNDLKFSATPSNGDDLFIAGGGNIGIGTNSPQRKLHVFKGSAGAFAAVSNTSAVFESNTANYITMLNPAINESGVLFGHPASSADGGILYNSGNTPNGLQFRTNGNIARFFIDNVGHVRSVGSQTLGRLMIAPSETFNGGDSELFLSEDDVGDYGMKFVYDGDDNNLLLMGKALTTEYGPHMVVNRSLGWVAIGTDTPADPFDGFKLSVGGKVACEEVLVELEADWPDYVFKPDYNLKSLSEVAQFIDDHGHLPGIPSAKEVEENGIEVGEMNRLLIEKVEELTLHLIEMKTELETLKNQVK